ncbi:beta-ketoacyl synthase N-terminal-like domain-containing protein [Roseibium salinum]|nr:beta-ketoacyl synthase N-terminal-like domain-containing protein [Roseibium salinum]
MPEPPAILPPRIARTVGLSARAAVSVLSEAWQEAGLDHVDPERIGLVVGGSNLMSRERELALGEYAGRLSYVPPRHGHMFQDTDICGVCATVFPIRGFAVTVGAASASGAVAVIQAVDAIRSGRVDVCIALGALQDLSAHDLQALRAMGGRWAPAGSRTVPRRPAGRWTPTATASSTGKPPPRSLSAGRIG